MDAGAYAVVHILAPVHLHKEKVRPNVHRETMRLGHSTHNLKVGETCAS